MFSILCTVFCYKLKPVMLCESLSSFESQDILIFDRHTTVTLGFHHDEVAFAEEARRHARKHGSKSREEWKYELLDLDEDDEDDGSGDEDEGSEVMDM
jgi:hypothetical protein